MHADVTMQQAEEGAVTGETAYSDPWRLEVDDIVLVTHQVPVDALHRELVADQAGLDEAGISQLFLIGDAQSPRWISEAVFDGHRLAREIDLPHPEFPAPVLRDLPA
jgi:dimethylamine/trimethylamine dehydrogenase